MEVTIRQYKRRIIIPSIKQQNTFTIKWSDPNIEKPQNRDNKEDWSFDILWYFVRSSSKEGNEN